MKNTGIALAALMFLFACGQTEQKNEVSGQKTAESNGLKTLEPTIGLTPDITDDAKKNLQRAKDLFATIDKIIQSYPDYETAKQHLTERQIAIYEDEEAYSKEDHLDVSTWGCSWYCGGGPDNIAASSVLKPNKALDYKAENCHDFSLRTAWVEGVPGYGIGESITYRFAKQSPPVTAIEIYNGYMKSESVWQENSRVKQLKLYVDGKPFALLNLQDVKSKQRFEVGTLQGTESELFLKFEITEVYKGTKFDDVALAEIAFDGTGVHCFAKGTSIATPTGEVAIEALNIGDKVLTFNELTKKVETSSIVEMASQKHHNLYELDFSGKKITATEDHPFFFDGKFYSVEANGKYGLQTQTLAAGQPISFFINGKIHSLELTSLKKLDACEITYTIVKLDRNRIFFANGAYVSVENAVGEGTL